MLRTRLPHLMLCLALVVAAGGCGSSPETRMYILDSTASAGSTPAPDLAVGVGPVTFSPYLDRAEIVTLAGSNQLHLADFDQWAEPLQAGFVRVLAEDLARALGTDQIDVEPGASNTGSDVRVAVDVVRFDLDARGTSRLLARWTLHGADGRLIPRRKSEISVKASAATYAGKAAAMSQAVAKLAGEIAEAIRAAR